MYFFFTFFIPSATRYYYPVAIDLSAGLSIYYYVLIRCCSGLWESDPMCMCTGFFFIRIVLHYYYFFFIILLLLLNPITLSKSIGTAFEMGAKKHKTGQTA